MTIAIFMGSLLGAMALGMPIAFALLLCGVALMYQQDLFDAQIVAQNVINGADSFPLMAVPFFMLAGEVMNTGGLSRRIVNLALTLVGHVKGGLGYVAILAACILSPSRLGGRRRRGALGAAGADDGPGRPRQGALGRADRGGRGHRAGHPAQHRLRHLRRGGQPVDLEAVPRRHLPGPAPRAGAGRRLVVGGARRGRGAAGQGHAGGAVARVRREHLGAGAPVHHHLRPQVRRVHAHRGRRWWPRSTRCSSPRWSTAS
jgi:hypothetical protein